MNWESVRFPSSLIRCGHRWFGRSDQRVESNFYKTTRRGEREEILRRLDNGQGLRLRDGQSVDFYRNLSSATVPAGHSAS